MAEAEEELDLDAKQKPSNKKRIMMYILGGLLLVGGSIGGTLLLVGGDAQSPGEGEAKEAQRPTPQYMPLDSMVVNFGKEGPARYLQVDIEMMAHEQAPLSALKKHMPVIRNNILMILGSQDFEVVTTREGKEQLRAEILRTLNEVLKEQADIEEGIQAVYFTSFVMQ